ncbi:MAG: hypothetical protein PXY39_07665 [archaeon]|nr:hypothetical protein [archaeon]
MGRVQAHIQAKNLSLYIEEPKLNEVVHKVNELAEKDKHALTDEEFIAIVKST